MYNELVQTRSRYSIRKHSRLPAVDFHVPRTCLNLSRETLCTSRVHFLPRHTNLTEYRMEFCSSTQEIRVILSSRLSLFCISLSPDTSERYTSECFLVSVFDAVSGESLAELHHSGARTGATSSSLFFLAVAILARSSQVLR